MDINSLKMWFSLGTALLIFIGHLTGFFKVIYNKIITFYQKTKNAQKRIVVHIENTMFPSYSTWWSVGFNGNICSMQITGRFVVANNTDEKVWLLGCYLKKFNYNGQVLIRNPSTDQFSSQFPILPFQTAKIAINFWIETLLSKEGEDFISDLAIIDNFGKKHWIKKVKFSYKG